jgi:phosphoserine phosphatase RsbU/P
MAIAKHKSLMYQVMENMQSMVRVMDDQENVIYMNKRMRLEFGDKTGEKCYTLLCRQAQCGECLSLKCKESKKDESKDVSLGDKHYRITASPAVVSEDEKYSIEIIHDITEQKNLESEFNNHYEKLKGDIAFAKQVQTKALPRDGIYWNALRVNSAYLPCEDLSGDLFDIIKIDDEKSLFYIADVSGHGVRSSLLTMFLRQVIRGMKAGAADQFALLDELIKSYNDLNLDKEQYLSFLCGLYNKQTKGLSLVNAGHNCPPLIIEKSDSGKPIITEIKIKGMPICSLLSRPNHEVKTLQMERGDRILLFTDGVTEAYNHTSNKEFGLHGLKQVVYSDQQQEGKSLVTQILEKAKDFAGPSPIDDMALISIDIL